MDFLSRINAVLRHQEPDQVPFAPCDNLVPRGDFVRELRNRGMGLCLRRSTIWAETPNVTIETRPEGDIALTIYHTPEGDVSTRTRSHADRIADGSAIEIESIRHNLTIAWICQGLDKQAQIVSNYVLDHLFYGISELLDPMQSASCTEIAQGKPQPSPSSHRTCVQAHNS